MQLRSLTDGSITGAGLLNVPSGMIAVLVTSDVTNAAVVLVRENNDTGKVVLQVSAKNSGLFPGPFPVRCGTKIYYSISGTNAAAQIFEVVD